MITLTTPAQVNSVLGGNSPVSYDKLVVGPFTFDPIGMVVNAKLRLTSTASAIGGTLTITTGTAVLEIAVERLDFYRRVVLTGPQNDAVMTIIRNAQNALESGLVSLGVVAGTQSTGS